MRTRKGAQFQQGALALDAQALQIDAQAADLLPQLAATLRLGLNRCWRVLHHLQQGMTQIHQQLQQPLALLDPGSGRPEQTQAEQGHQDSERGP